MRIYPQAPSLSPPVWMIPVISSGLSAVRYVLIPPAYCFSASGDFHSRVRQYCLHSRHRHFIGPPADLSQPSSPGFIPQYAEVLPHAGGLRRMFQGVALSFHPSGSQLSSDIHVLYQNRMLFTCRTCRTIQAEFLFRDTDS